MTKSIKVLKKPLSFPMANRPKAFPAMPILYLELIENKKKIKPSLVNTEFVPGKSIENTEQKAEMNTNQPSPPIDRPQKSAENQQVPSEKSIAKRQKKPLIEIIDDNDTLMEIPKTKTIDSRPRPSSYPKKKSIVVDPIESKLKKLLNESDHEGEFIKKTRSSVLNKPTLKDDDKLEEQNVNLLEPPKMVDPLPPRLSELPKGDAAPITGTNLKNINLKDVTDSKEQDNLKNEMLFKFGILKKKYKDAVIPEFNQWSDYETMKRTYETTIKNLALDSAVDNYKKYLMAGFILLEFAVGKFISDASGFAQQQMVSISSYDKLLIELGEKSFAHQPSNIPVEIRLVGIVVFNMFLFIIMKLVFRKTGVSMMQGMQSQSSTNANTKKRKMRGPSVNLD